MTRFQRSTAAAAALVLAAGVQFVQAQDAPRPVSDGGIRVDGWHGKIDAREASRGAKLEDAKLVKDGEALHITTGPAVVYWNPANTAKGNYTVSATFTESKYMGLNDHPHPYGIVIAGNDLGTDTQSLLYCAAYGSGTFIMRGFGPEPFQVSERRPTAHDAIHKAAGQGQPVTQMISVSVTNDAVTCSVNGTVVGTYPKADVVTAGKLKSTDGVWGVRAAHNTEVMVSGLRVTQN